MSRVLITNLNHISDSDLLEQIENRFNDSRLNNATSDELKGELENRGYYVYDCEMNEDIEDYDMDEIIDHVEETGCTVIEKPTIMDYLYDLPPYKLKDLFCDLVGVNHHTPKDELMKLLSEKI